MDEKKMLNGMELHDEELDKVVGGLDGNTSATLAYPQSDGTVYVCDADLSCCYGKYYWGSPGIECCVNCHHYKKRRCTSVDYYNELTKG